MSGLLPRCLQGPRTVSHRTCCCSPSLDRCARCDLLVNLEGFHLMSVARTPDALVLDVESCIQLVGCPGCGLNRTRPRARGAGGDRRSGGTIRRWIRREHTCQIATFKQNPLSVCSRARLGTRAIRWAINVSLKVDNLFS